MAGLARKSSGTGATNEVSPSLNSFEADGVQEKPESISRILSRSSSTKNLQQKAAAPSSLFSSSLEKYAQQLVFEKEIRMSQSHYFCSPASIKTTSIASRSKSSPATFQKEELPMKPGTGTTETILFGTKPTTALSNCPPENPCKDVYRSFEMYCDAGDYVLPEIIQSSDSKIVDDYNYEIFSCNPLQDPPRLPSAMESFKIAERSREEKNNWGWYA